MKLLVSDYDLTLNVMDYDVRFNLYAINKFRKNGNMFFLNTGRSYESIKREINKYRINYDYLGCCDGNLVLNRNNDIVYCNNLSKSILSEINSLRDEFDFKVNEVCYKNNVLEYEIRVIENEIFDRNLREIAIKNDLLVSKFTIPVIKNYKFRKISIYFLYDKKINKSYATDYISKLENIEKCDIFTIGDNHNDYEMIRDYNGYTFTWGKKEVKDVSDGKVLSVASLVKKIMR